MHPAVNVRFAPSPTGALHIGSVRTILYNYLLAKKTGGRFILRIEDTDQKRFIPSAESYILESLKWLGIVPDEGPTQGGDHGPYRQSERKAIYQQHIQPLLDAGHAYYAFDTPEELDAMRERLKAAKIANPLYNAISRTSMRNALTLPAEQVSEWLALGKPYVIRLNVPPKEWIRFYDGIRGWIKVDGSVLDDKVLMKSDGIPTYHFASVIDDHQMEITHVIRGEEWLPSTPIHVLLYRYLGWEEQMPQFMHLPLLLAPNGQGKLSKRHADQYGFPAFPITWASSDLTVTNGFREQGYLPEALLNFLALLGWNPGTPQEIFTKEELIEAFSLERIGKSAVQFDITKANWFNQQHIKKQPTADWVDYFQIEASKENIRCSKIEAAAVCNLVQDNVTFPKDFWKLGKCFFIDPTFYDPILVQKKWNAQSQKVLHTLIKQFSTICAWNPTEIRQALKETTTEHNLTMGNLLPLLRMALTGSNNGPDLIATMVLLGKTKTYKRLHTFIAQHS